MVRWPLIGCFFGDGIMSPTWLHWDDYECRETANHQPISNSWHVVERRFRVVAQIILFNEHFRRIHPKYNLSSWFNVKKPSIYKL